MNRRKRRLETYIIHPLRIFFSSRYETSLSQRKTKLCGYLRAYKEEKFIVLPLEEDGKPKYALDELEEMSIRCAYCGKAIFVDDQVTIFKRESYGTLHVYGAVQHSVEPEEWIGCTREDCKNNGTIAGYWGPSEFHFGRGRIHRFQELRKPTSPKKSIITNWHTQVGLRS
jgi:DNA-directed RNA polymerase subunit RPC12/RpoP